MNAHLSLHRCHLDYFYNILIFYSSFGYFSVFGVLILCGFGLPVPEDVSILAGGIITGLGYGNVHVMLVVCFMGVMIGDTIVYSLGRFSGEKIFSNKIGKRILNHSWYDRILKSFREHGMIVLFVARFLPGLRTPIFLTAGVTRFVGLIRFIIIDGLAALVSVPIWLYLGYYSASNREVLIRWVKDAKMTVFLILLLLVVVYVIIKVVKKRIIRARLISPDIEQEH